MEWLIGIIVGLAAFIFMNSLFCRCLFSEKKLTTRSSSHSWPRELWLIQKSMRYSRPLRHFLKHVQNKWILNRSQSRLVAAGWQNYLDEYELMASECFFVLFSFLLFALLFWSLTTAMVMALTALLYWEYALHIAIDRRKKAVRDELPETLDLLVVSIEAGMDFLSAIKTISEKNISEKNRGKVITTELRQICSDLQRGASREEAFHAFSRRLPFPLISQFVATIIQGSRLGTPIGVLIRSQSRFIRAQQFEAAEKEGVIAAQKLLIPLVGCIMPAVVMIIFGPLFVRFMMGELWNY